MIGDVPTEDGAFQVTRTPSARFGLVPSCCGTPGTVPGAVGVAARLFEAAPVPTMLVALTVNEYVVLLVRPLTEQPRPAVVQVAPPGLAVTV